jgi:hypothetical protein
MTTQQIIETINNFTPFSDNDSENDNESFFYESMEELKSKRDFKLAIEPIFKLIEKNPLSDFGFPRPFVHTLESFIGDYENYLFESLNRRPTPLTVFMLNRIINGEKNIIIKENLILRLKALLTHPSLDKETTDAINRFVTYQTKNE